VSCSWAKGDATLVHYHDREWGTPNRDSRDLWEALVLDGFQAGLTWRTILFKREAFRAAFKGFDPEKVARFDESDVERLMKDKGIVRSHAKVRAAISNARAYLDLKSRGEDFSTFVWSLLGGKPIQAAADYSVSKTAESATDHQGSQSAGLQVRRPRSRSRLDAGRRHDQRSRAPLLPPSGADQTERTLTGCEI
jgi:DNA-3-methyladenine glycosylase I